MIGPDGFMAAPKEQPRYKPQWRAECIYCAGWGAKRWAVFFVDANGKAIEQSMRNGKKRTFLREARAEAEAARLNAAMLSNA